MAASAAFVGELRVRHPALAIRRIAAAGSLHLEAAALPPGDEHPAVLHRDIVAQPPACRQITSGIRSSFNAIWLPQFGQQPRSTALQLSPSWFDFQTMRFTRSSDFFVDHNSPRPAQQEGCRRSHRNWQRTDRYRLRTSPSKVPHPSPR